MGIVGIIEPVLPVQAAMNQESHPQERSEGMGVSTSLSRDALRSDCTL
jgi:hypothetical protein